MDRAIAGARRSGSSPHPPRGGSDGCPADGKDVVGYAEILRARPGTSVEEAMLRGGFPELHERPEIDARGFYQSYVATYLERDLRSLLQVGNLRDFERFTRAAALRSSQMLNRAELARDVGIAPSTAGQWLSVLERSGVVSLLEPWFSNAGKSLVKSPKLHFQDAGLCAFLMGMTSREDLHESPIAGALWETMVFSEFQRLLSTGQADWQFAYWRDRTKEADFLLHRAGRVRLADAKWTSQPSGAGRLAGIASGFDPLPEQAIICRCAHSYPLGKNASAVPLGELGEWMR